jgi:Raf kinase inhibitor-like YbhB/YbcL family protein
MSVISSTATLQISSPSFNSNGTIPSKFTCEGENVNPALLIRNIPGKTVTLALIVDDPDAPGGTFDHWIVWNIRPLEKISENSIPGIEGINGFGKKQFKGPCPPTGTHRYFFKLYALDTSLNIPAGSTKQALEKAMKGHILGYGELVGLYKKIK